MIKQDRKLVTYNGFQFDEPRPIQGSGKLCCNIYKNNLHTGYCAEGFNVNDAIKNTKKKIDIHLSKKLIKEN
jgi:hypothetical protein